LDLRRKVGIEANLYDVSKNKKILSKKYIVSKQDRYPFLSHKLVVDVGEELDINDLQWMQKFVIFSKYVGKKKSNIYIADYSLTFVQPVISGGLKSFSKVENKKNKKSFYTKISNKRGYFVQGVNYL